MANPQLVQCLLQAMIVLKFLHKGDRREFLLSLTSEYMLRFYCTCTSKLRKQLININHQLCIHTYSISFLSFLC